MKWREWRLQASTVSLPWSFLMDLIATTSSQSTSEFLHYFKTFFQPPLVCSHLLDSSISLIFLFFLQGMIGFSSPLILSCWSVAGRWTSWWLHLLRHHLQHSKTEVQKNAPHKNPNLILVSITSSSLAYQYVCHHHLQSCPEGISHCSQVMW